MAILLASQFAFISSPAVSQIVKIKASRFQKVTLAIIFFGICGLVLALTEGRSGLAGFLVALIIIHCSLLKKLTLLKKIFVTILGAFFTLILVAVKPASSNGRFLIYKVIYNELPRKSIIRGIGYGGFKSQYNFFQSEYFKQNHVDSKDASLADNTYFLFNDPLQIVVELGLFGLVLIFCFLFILIRQFILDIRDNFNHNIYLKGAYSSVCCFLTGSLFSYPFQVPGLLTVFIFAMAIIFRERLLQMFSLTKIIISFLNPLQKVTASVVAFICFIGFTIRTAYTYKITENAQHLYRAGFKRESAAVYSRLTEDQIVNPNVYLEYAKLLSELKIPDSAILQLHIFENSSITISSPA